MNKALFQGAALGCFFIALWLSLSQIDFMRIFQVEKTSETTEEKLGKLFWETIQDSETIITHDSVNKNVRKIIDRISQKNSIDGKKIKLHIVRDSDINAFAMPDNHLIVFSGLIADCENESELAGVLGHEIAHMQKKHVMKKLIREVGLSVLLSMTTGGGGSQAVKEAARHLSASAYDRTLETEADLASVDYLVKAGINPAPFADLLFRMSTSDAVPAGFYWISSHPESEERAKEILKYAKGRKGTSKRILTSAEWASLKKASAE